MSINTLRPHKANSRPGNCTRPLEAETLDKLKPQKKIIVAANQIKLNHETAIQESVSLHVVQRNQEKAGVCLNARRALATARSPREGTEQALGERQRCLRSSPTPSASTELPRLSTPRELQPQSSTLSRFTPQTGAVTPDGGLGESSDNLPCPGELICNRKPGRAPVKSVP